MMNLIFDLLNNASKTITVFETIAAVVAGVVTIGKFFQWLWKKYVVSKEKKIEELELELKEEKEKSEQLRIHNAEMKIAIGMTSSYLNEKETILEGLKEVTKTESKRNHKND